MTYILIGDEDSTQVEILQKTMRVNPSVKIAVAKDGLEAFRKVRVEKFDLIVLHSTLHKISAMQLVTAIRELPNNGQTPIVVLTDSVEETKKSFDKSKETHILDRKNQLDELRNFVNELVSPIKKSKVEPSPIRVDVRIVNQFVEATDFSMRMFSSLEKIQSRPIEAMHNSQKIDQIVIFGATAILSTMFAGTIIIGFPRNTYLKIVSAVFGEDQKEINSENSDAAGELINIIYGQAKTVLVDELGLDFMKSRAYVVEGKEKVRSYQTPASFVVPFDSEFGEFYLIISFDSLKVGQGPSPT